MADSVTVNIENKITLNTDQLKLAIQFWLEKRTGQRYALEQIHNAGTDIPRFEVRWRETQELKVKYT